MLKIHSFLQRIMKPVSKLLPNIGKYKTHMAIIAYAMITVLFILSPDYINGASNKGVESYAKAETIRLAGQGIEEETANVAIVRTNQNNLNSAFILCDLSTGSPLGYEEQQTLELIEEGKVINNSTVQSITTKASKADSKQEGADAKEEDTVDSSSTKEIKKENTKEAVNTKQETEKSATKDTVQRVIDLSSKDIEMLQRIVEAEATGEDSKGKELVANVILNRVNDDHFPNSIEGVIFQKDGNTYQFSPIRDDRYWSVVVTQDTIAAVENVMQGKDDSQGALYFSARARASSSSMKWFDNNLEFLFKYGGHEFFR